VRQDWSCAFPILTSNYDTFADGVVVDNTNNLIVAGHFFGTATFGSQRGAPDKGISLTSRGSYDSFVQKVNQLGTMLWVTQLVSGSGANEAAHVAANRYGTRMYVSGTFDRLATFGYEVRPVDEAAPCQSLSAIISERR
jgi:hypothetical protein